MKEQSNSPEGITMQEEIPVLSTNKTKTRLSSALLLIVCSCIFTFFLLRLLDYGIGRFLFTPFLAAHTGLIFPPDVEQHASAYEFSYVANINSLGLRNREIPLEKEKGTLRIAVIGDSFTFGWGVADDETWCAHLEQYFKKQNISAEVINVGKPGAGPDYYVEVAERAIPVLKPDIVIVALLFDDILDFQVNTTYRKWIHLLHFVQQEFPNLTKLVHPPTLSEPPALRTNTQGHIVQTASTDPINMANAQSVLEHLSPELRKKFESLEPEVQTAFCKGKINPIVLQMGLGGPNYFDAISIIKNENPPLHIPHVGQCLNTIRQIASRTGAKTLAVSIPLGPFVNKEAWQNVHRLGYQPSEALLHQDEPDQNFQEAAALAGIPFLNITHQFRQMQDMQGLYFPLDGHFTAAGHALYAQLLSPALLEWIRTNR